MWHDLYLRTCAANPTVQWIIVHDGPVPTRKPENVRFVQMTKDDFARRSSKALDVSFTLASGYKGGDLRPALGAIFADCLCDFDFWGYNDSDLFWGDIRRFVTEEMLTNYDIITSCRASIVGQFTIFRNSGVTRDAYQLIPEYKERLVAAKAEYLEETVLDRAVQANGVRICRKQLQIHDENSVEWEAMARQWELEEKGNLNEWFWEGGPCLWKDGHLYHLATGKETMFFHFKTWKFHWRDNSLLRPLTYRDSLHDGFTITKEGIRLRYKRQWFLLGWASSILHGSRRAIYHLRKTLERIVRGLKRRLSKSE